MCSPATFFQQHKIIIRKVFLDVFGKATAFWAFFVGDSVVIGRETRFGTTVRVCCHQKATDTGATVTGYG